MPPKRLLTRLADRVGVQFLVGIDLVAVFLAELTRDAQRFAVCHQQHADRRGDHRQVRGERHERQGELRQALGKAAHDLYAVIGVQAEHGAQRDIAKEDDQPGRDLFIPARQQEQQRERAGAHRKGDPVCLRQLAHDGDELFDRVALALRHAEQLVKLADRDKERQAGDKPVHHGLRQELRDEAEARHAGQEKDDADDQDKRRGVRLVERRVRGRAFVDERPGDQHPHHRRGEQRRRRRGGLDHEVARGAQQCVHQQRGEQGVEARLRRQTGDAGIGHRLGHDQAPQRQPGEDIGGQPPTIVGGQPGQDRDVAAESAGPGGFCDVG